MGLWDTLKNHAGAQFLDVIQWLDDSNDTLVYRFPIFNQAIQDGGKLVVRPGQAAVFVSEGQLSDVFGPGTYELSTRTKAVSSFFDSIKYQFNYPYKGDIYFVSTKRFSDQKWGTSAPFLFEDPQYGGIEVRAFGIFEYRVVDPAKFLSEVVGTDGVFTTAEINGQLKRMLVEAFRAACKRMAAEKGLNVNQLDSHFFDLKDAFLEKMSPMFQEKYGIALTDFTVEALNLPDDLRALLNKRREMDMLGDPNRYMQFQAANALGDAARNPGMGGAMMGAGVGLGMGGVLGQQVAQGLQPQARPPAPPPPPPAEMSYHYNGAGGQGELSAREIAQKVAANRGGAHNVWAAGWPGWKSWQDVPEIASLVAPAPPPPPAAELRFHYAGPDGQSELGASEVAARVKAAPTAQHRVWREGFSGWMSAQDVPEIARLLNSGPPPLPPAGGPPPLP